MRLNGTSAGAGDCSATEYGNWVIDLGPEGGVAGGQLIAEGTPEDVAKVEKSYTGQCLKEML